jgi:hypothetical protein
MQHFVVLEYRNDGLGLEKFMSEVAGAAIRQETTARSRSLQENPLARDPFESSAKQLCQKL